MGINNHQGMLKRRETKAGGKDMRIIQESTDSAECSVMLTANPAHSKDYNAEVSDFNDNKISFILFYLMDCRFMQNSKLKRNSSWIKDFRFM